MKKALLLIVLTLACASVSGQEKKDPQIVADLQENIFRAGVNTNPYEYLPIAETPVPKGFKPFYISHYGRHGSRSDWSRDNYPPLLEQFTAAHDAGLLTQEGETAFERIKEVIANHNGNDGALTRLGTQEHRQIAGRMYDKYGKTVFNKKGPRKVRAISSTVQRCIVSMSAFTGELISRDPGLDIWWNTGESYMPVCSTSDPDDVRAEARKILRAQSEAHVPDTAAFMKRIFTDPAKARELVGDPVKLMERTYYAAAGCAAFGMDSFLLRTFSDDDLYWYTQNRSMSMYLRQCNSVEFGDRRMESVEALVDDIIAKGDEAVAGGDCCADLRFGHDYQLMAISSRLGIRGVGERLDRKGCRNWRGYHYTPFAGNLQIIFYKDKKGEVLVKFYLNEREATTLLLEGGPYYRWEDFKKAVKYRPSVGLPEIAVTAAECKEISGLYPAPDGNGWIAASDEDGVWHISTTGEATPVYVAKDGIDCEGVTVDPATNDIYFVVEGEQELRRLAAPDYSNPELIYTVTDIGVGTNRGLEGVTWYGDGVILLGNQYKPVEIIKYSVTEGRELDRWEVKGSSEVGDLFYDASTGFLWIIDSEKFVINLCNIRGELIKRYPIPGIANAEGLCIDHAASCIWVGDDETSRIYKIPASGL